MSKTATVAIAANATLPSLAQKELNLHNYFQ